MKNIVMLTLLVLFQFGFSQSKGTVKGLVTDKDMNGEPLPFANVFIKGTSVGSTTEMDGTYSIQAPVGAQTIVFSFVGYQTVEKAVNVVAGKTTTLNQELGASQGQQLDNIQINATVSKEKESALIINRKKAATIETKIGAQELSRKGVSDLSDAVTKTTGVTKQEGTGSVFVRGLGDRYNSTTMNGLPLPSNNANRKNIDMSIFSTDIVESIGISKTFETQNYGDFGGAAIDIKSKNFIGKPYVKFNVGVIGTNTNVLNLKHFYLQEGPSLFGFNKGKKISNPLKSINYGTSWDRVDKYIPINNSIGVSMGKSFKVGESSKLNTFFTASFGNKSNFREGNVKGKFNSRGYRNADFDFKRYTYNTNTNAMANINFKINENHKLKVSSLFLNSSDQNYQEYFGSDIEFATDNYYRNGKLFDDFGIIKRSTFEKTQLFVNQLLGQHNLNEKKINIDWGIGYSNVKNETPDRMQNTFIPDSNIKDNFNFFDNSPASNHRFFQELKENELTGKLSLALNFAKDEDEAYNGKVTLGYSGKMKESSLYSDQFALRKISRQITFTENNIHSVDTYINDEFLNQGYFRIEKSKQYYDGTQNIHGGYANVSYKFTPNFSVIVGARAEYLNQKIEFLPLASPFIGTSEFDNFEILPSIISKVTINDKNNIKFAASKSYTLPQIKESVKYIFQGVTQEYQGNEDLYASTNYNADLSWEYYPTRTEFISATIFGKLIKNPINEAFINSASQSIGYVNSGDQAEVAGIEIEVKKLLAKFERTNDLESELRFGVNGSYIHTNQDLNEEKISNETALGANFTFENSVLQGASEILANADISYKHEFSEDANTLLTVTYAYFSDKLSAIGAQGKGNLIDKGNQILNFVGKLNLSKRTSISFKANNILNPTYTGFMDTTGSEFYSYKKGTSFSLGLSYKF